MAAELQEPDPTLLSNKATTVAPPLAPPLASTGIPSVGTTQAAHHVQPENRGPTLATKRQRRPSVRLGEIGHQSYDSHSRRTKHQNHPPGRFSRESTSTKSVKARSITNLVNGGGDENELNGNPRAYSNNLEFSHRKAKAKRVTTKRVRSNWIPIHEEGPEAENSGDEGEEGFRDFDPDSDSQLKEQSPIQSADNMALYSWQRRSSSGPSRARVSDNDALEMDNMPESDNDRKYGTGEGVRSWLIELGLSRYAPVFEIHEVDDEVLPLLTLEDLKDMGINAVGSRRKLYTAIQKLPKGYS